MLHFDAVDKECERVPRVPADGVLWPQLVKAALTAMQVAK